MSVIEEVSKTGEMLAPGVLDPYSALEAEERALLREADARGGRLLAWLRGDRWAIRAEIDERRRALERRVPKEPSRRLMWAKQALVEQIAEQRAKVEALVLERKTLEARLVELHRADGRTLAERAARMAPHRPEAQIYETRQQMERLRQQIEMERGIGTELERSLPGKLEELDRRIANHRVPDRRSRSTRLRSP